MEIIKNVLKTIGIFILVLIVMIVISVTMTSIFFKLRFLYWISFGSMLIILIWIIWEAVTN